MPRVQDSLNPSFCPIRLIILSYIAYTMVIDSTMSMRILNAKMAESPKNIIAGPTPVATGADFLALRRREKKRGFPPEPEIGGLE